LCERRKSKRQYFDLGYQSVSSYTGNWFRRTTLVNKQSSKLLIFHNYIIDQNGASTYNFTLFINDTDWTESMFEDVRTCSSADVLLQTTLESCQIGVLFYHVNFNGGDIGLHVSNSGTVPTDPAMICISNGSPSGGILNSSASSNTPNFPNSPNSQRISAAEHINVLIYFSSSFSV
jgi:hypothetical protein